MSLLDDIRIMSSVIDVHKPCTHLEADWGARRLPGDIMKVVTRTPSGDYVPTPTQHHPHTRYYLTSSSDL